MSFKTKANTYLIWRRIWNRYSFLTFQVLRIQRYIWPNPSPSCLKVAPVKFPLSSSLSHPRYNSTSTNMSNRLVLVSAELKATWNDQVNSSSMIFFAHPGSVQYLALWFYDYTFFIKYNMYFEKFSSPLFLILLIVTLSYKRLHNIPERKIIKIP